MNKEKMSAFHPSSLPISLRDRACRGKETLATLFFLGQAQARFEQVAACDDADELAWVLGRHHEQAADSFSRHLFHGRTTRLVGKNRDRRDPDQVEGDDGALPQV